MLFFFAFVFLVFYCSKANCISTGHSKWIVRDSRPIPITTFSWLGESFKNRHATKLRTLQKGGFAWFSLENFFLSKQWEPQERHPRLCWISQSRSSLRLLQPFCSYQGWSQSTEESTVKHISQKLSKRHWLKLTLKSMPPLNFHIDKLLNFWFISVWISLSGICRPKPPNW